MEIFKVDLIEANLTIKEMYKVLRNLKVLRDKVVPDILKLDLQEFNNTESGTYCAIGYCMECEGYFDLDWVNNFALSDVTSIVDIDDNHGVEIIAKYSNKVYDKIQYHLFRSFDIEIKLKDSEEWQTLAWYLFLPAYDNDIDEYGELDNNFTTLELAKTFNTSKQLYMQRLESVINVFEKYVYNRLYFLKIKVL